MKKRILPVVVIYRCTLNESTAYRTLVAQEALVDFVVVDNSPADYLQDQAQLPPEAHYHRDESNGGLSTAYNYGARLARELGYDWLLLLDQDTQFPPGAFRKYEAALEHHRMLVPNVVLKDGRPFSPCRPGWTKMVPLTLAAGTYSLKEYGVINSGCCVPLDDYTAAGGYKDDVRLDFSDYQFQRRLRQVNEEFEMIDVVAVQDFSNDETDAAKLMNRFGHYLDGALHCDAESGTEKIRRHLQVLKHTLALTARTRKFQFFNCYIKKYLLKI